MEETYKGHPIHIEQVGGTIRFWVDGREQDYQEWDASKTPVELMSAIKEEIDFQDQDASSIANVTMSVWSI